MLITAAAFDTCNIGVIVEIMIIIIIIRTTGIAVLLFIINVLYESNIRNYYKYQN
jgi:hypothetical protein